MVIFILFSFIYYLMLYLFGMLCIASRAGLDWRYTNFNYYYYYYLLQ